YCIYTTKNVVYKSKVIICQS
ncbi:hypothetical protein Trydic_g10570, partial [Trypoxylus dichotomus]